MLPLAQKAAKVLGVNPAILVAQSALETGWGAKMTGAGQGKTSNNLFNIKADGRWQGGSVTVPTLEVKGGVAVRENAAFRAYDSIEGSFDDYVEFVSNNPRYQQAVSCGDSEDYIRHLEAAGYATDPSYADKILNIFNGDSLQKVLTEILPE